MDSSRTPPPPRNYISEWGVSRLHLQVMVPSSAKLQACGRGGPWFLCSESCDRKYIWSISFSKTINVYISMHFNMLWISETQILLMFTNINHLCRWYRQSTQMLGEVPFSLIRFQDYIQYSSQFLSYRNLLMCWQSAFLCCSSQLRSTLGLQM